MKHGYLYSLEKLEDLAKVWWKAAAVFTETFIFQYVAASTITIGSASLMS